MKDLSDIELQMLYETETRKITPGIAVGLAGTMALAEPRHHPFAKHEKKPKPRIDKRAKVKAARKQRLRGR